MALGHLRVKVFTRSRGHSVVAKAAYRAGATLHDARLGITFRFSGKRHVDDATILAPEGAPDWVFDRERLWNTVEGAEKRADSQLAKELQIALPVELTHAQQTALLHDFVREHFVARGMVADCAIHRPEGNPHAHVMLTMRELGTDGFGKKRRDWNERDLKSTWRQDWEHAVNRALEEAGHQQRIDMRSFADRGVELEAEPKRYRSVADVLIDGRDHVLEQQAEAQHVARRNGERIAENPAVLLELLTSRQSVFTEHDLLRAIHRYSVDAQQFERVRLAVFASHELVSLHGDGEPPRFSTRKVVATELSLHTHAQALALRHRHAVRQEHVQRALSSGPLTLTEEQALAVRHLTTGGDLALVQGYAGTGKSTMLAAARAAWEAEGYTVLGAALAGKAAEGLSDPHGAGIAARTLASWQWAWDHGRARLTRNHVLVIDEAGMVGTAQLERVLARAAMAGAKVVLVGDTRQLQAIDPGAPMRALQDEHGAAKLTQVIRQRAHAWQAEATRLFAEGQADAALRQYLSNGRVQGHATREAAQAAVIECWAKDRERDRSESSIVLAYRRKDVFALNELARAVRRDQGELGADQPFDTKHGLRAFAEGERLYFLKNDRALGVTNGTLGTLETVRGNELGIRLDGGRLINVDVSLYDAIDYGYATTIHKSQGVTVDRAYVLGSRYMDASATYVALSRHRKDVQLCYAETEFRSERSLLQRLSRQRQSSMALDREIRLPDARELDEAQRRERRFLSLSDSEQLAQLAKWKMAGDRHPLSAAEVLERLPEVRAASGDRDRSALQRTEATRALHDLQRAHPLAAVLRASSVRSVEAACASAQAEAQKAERALEAVVTDPERRARAARIAGQHNHAIKEAREQWSWGNALRTRQQRDELIRGYADAANQRRGDQAFRPATREDEGKSFDVLLKRQVGGEPVFVLRAHPGSELVIADARLFRAEPAVGTRAVLEGRAPVTKPGRVSKGRSTREGDRGWDD